MRDRMRLVAMEESVLSIELFFNKEEIIFIEVA